MRVIAEKEEGARRGWRHHLSSPVHVWPNYGPLHDVEGDDGRCWCGPVVERQPNGNVVIVHRDPS